MNWPSCRLKPFSEQKTFAVQLPLSFERALQEATVNVKAQKQEFDFQKEIILHRSMMLNRAMAKLRNRDEAENFVQEAFLKALLYNSRKPWQPTSKNPHNDLSAWLCRITDNLIISHFRKQREITVLENINPVSNDVYFEREEIDSYIQSMESDERDVIEMSMEGLKQSSIVKLYGGTAKTVRSIQEKGFKKLREKMG